MDPPHPATVACRNVAEFPLKKQKSTFVIKLNRVPINRSNLIEELYQVFTEIKREDSSIYISYGDLINCFVPMNPPMPIAYVTICTEFLKIKLFSYIMKTISMGCCNLNGLSAIENYRKPSNVVFVGDEAKPIEQAAVVPANETKCMPLPSVGEKVHISPVYVIDEQRIFVHINHSNYTKFIELCTNIENLHSKPMDKVPGKEDLC